MQLLFESQLAITDIKGKLYFFLEQPEVLPEPVLRPDRPSDGNRASVQTVLCDGGRYRMWYLAFPDPKAEELGSMVAYAESDDGLTWHKPDLDIVTTRSFSNNYCDLGLCSPTVFIDPHSPATHRYRATGYLRPSQGGATPQGTIGCYYTAHSADGLHWDLDSPHPRWFSGDVINSIYHAGQRRGICAMKFVRRMNGINRRSIWHADMIDGEWGEPMCALVPDEFDDVAAIARGHNSTDYYGMGLLPAGRGTVGFLLNFRHTLPLSMGPEHYAIFGTSDITLVYQAQPGDRWLHVPGRKSFVAAGTHDWNQGWVDSASTAVEKGDNHLLYINGAHSDHAWHKDEHWKNVEKWTDFVARNERSAVGVARWKKWRMFGYHADPEGVMEVEMGPSDRPCELLLNYRAAAEGSVRVQVFDRERRGDCNDFAPCSNMENVVPLTGDSTAEVVRWRSGTRIPPVPDKRLVARLTMENARVYAWDLRPVE